MFFRPWKTIIRILMETLPQHTTKAPSTMEGAVQATAAALSHLEICRDVH
jgi:hypothetical protein